MTMHVRTAMETKSAALIERKDAGGEAEPLDEVRGAVEGLQAAFEEFKTGQEKRLGEVETKAAGDELGKRLDEFEKRLNRPGGTGAPKGDEVERKAFFTYARQGRDFLDETSRKALRVADDVAGGYIVAPEAFVTDLLKETALVSPIRRLARVTTIGGGGIRIPRRTSGPTAYWVDEIEERSRTDIAYAQTTIGTHTAAAYIDVSQELLEDSAIDLEAELRVDFASEFARLETDAFVRGDGVKKPLGFMADPDVFNVANGSTTELSADALIDLFYAVPSDVAATAVCGMNRRTMGGVRKLKDANGQYLWQNSLAAGQPPSILGRPVEELPEMDEAIANARPVIFGDFAKGYRIFDRVNLSILRDPFTMATRGLVRFHFRRRVGGGVAAPAALRTLKMALAV